MVLQTVRYLLYAYKHLQDFTKVRPVNMDFYDFIFVTPYNLPEDFTHRVGYHCSNRTAAGKVYTCDLSRYCHLLETSTTSTAPI